MFPKKFHHTKCTSVKAVSGVFAERGRNRSTYAVSDLVEA
jgi:hypothetical protein